MGRLDATARSATQHVLAARSNAAGDARSAQPVDPGAVKGAALDATRVDVSATRRRSTCSRVFGDRHDVGRLDLRHARAARADADGASARSTRSTFTVTDAGDPVKGATVKAGGKSGKTDARAASTLTLEEQVGLARDRRAATSLQS